jgi:hypothetical protein
MKRGPHSARERRGLVRLPDEFPEGAMGEIHHVLGIPYRVVHDTPPHQSESMLSSTIS